MLRHISNMAIINDDDNNNNNNNNNNNILLGFIYPEQYLLHKC